MAERKASAWTLSDHPAVRDSAHVVEWSGKRESETTIEVFGRELCGQYHLICAGPIGGVEEEPHHKSPCPLTPGIRHGRNPGDERLAASRGRKGQAAG